MRHGEPVEGQEDVLDVLHVHHGRVVVGVDEVCVVRQPADAKNDDQNHQHLDNLWQGGKKLVVTEFPGINHPIYLLVI